MPTPQLPALTLAGNTQANFTMATSTGVIACSSQLNAGTYGVWATQNAWIGLGAPPSSALSSATGYLIVGGAAPVPVVVPPSFQIAAVSSSSGVIAYQKVAG